MMMMSIAMIRTDHSGNAVIRPNCAMAWSDAKMMPRTRAAELPTSSPKPLSAAMAPITSVTQPQVVMSQMIAPRPPTVTTWSLRIAARPYMTARMPLIIRMMPANITQPLFSVSGTAGPRTVGPGAVAIRCSFPGRESGRCQRAHPGCPHPSAGGAPTRPAAPRRSRRAARADARVPAPCRSARDLGVREVGRLEREVVGDPATQGAIELLVVAARVRGRCDPPADVHVVAQQLARERRAAAHRIEVATAEICTTDVAHHVRERRALAELELVPHQVHQVVLGAHRLGRPAATARRPDQRDALVDAPDVVVQVVARDRRGHQVLEGQLGGRREPGRARQLPDEVRVVHRGGPLA